MLCIGCTLLLSNQEPVVDIFKNFARAMDRQIERDRAERKSNGLDQDRVREWQAADEVYAGDERGSGLLRPRL